MQLDSSFFWMPREVGTMHRFWLQNYNVTQKLTGACGDSCVLPCSSPVRGSTKTERHHTFQGREGFLSWLFDGMRLFKPVHRQCFIFLFVLFERWWINSPRFYLLSRALWLMLVHIPENSDMMYTKKILNFTFVIIVTLTLLLFLICFYELRSLYSKWNFHCIYFQW